MKRAHSLARLNGRILATYSRRTTTALRAALPLRLALPHLEPVLALNVEKEVEKDRLVILRAREHAADTAPDWNELLPQLLQATKEIDRLFLARVGRFPVEIVVRYDEIMPHQAALRRCHENPGRAQRHAAPARRHARNIRARGIRAAAL